MTFEEALTVWMEKVQTMLNTHYSKNFPTLDVPKLVKAGGTKYLKINNEYMGGSDLKPEKRTSIYAFIEVATGNVLKPQTWKAPAKHARGNIYDESGVACCGPYGVAYLDTKGKLQHPYGLEH